MKTQLKTVALALGALAIVIFAGPAARAMDCDTYANNAIAIKQRSDQLNCGFSGARWEATFEQHRDWCVANNDKGWPADEANARQQLINKCEFSGVKKDPFKVCFYADANFEGKESCFLTSASDGAILTADPREFYEYSRKGWLRYVDNIEEYSAASRGINDTFSSVRVGSKALVLIYEDEAQNNHQDGHAKEITEDLAYLGDDWNDKITSLIVQVRPDKLDQVNAVAEEVRNALQACFYKTIDASDAEPSCYMLTSGASSDSFEVADVPQGLNNTFQAVRLGAAVKLSLFEYNEFEGRSITLLESAIPLPDDWQNLISSFKIERGQNYEETIRRADLALGSGG